MSKSVVRSVKNVTKGYSSTQIKTRHGKCIAVRNDISCSSSSATSNDAWGPTGTEMSEIAQMTFNGYVIPGDVRAGADCG